MDELSPVDACFVFWNFDNSVGQVDTEDEDDRNGNDGEDCAEDENFDTSGNGDSGKGNDDEDDAVDDGHIGPHIVEDIFPWMEHIPWLFV